MRSSYYRTKRLIFAIAFAFAGTSHAAASIKNLTQLDLHTGEIIIGEIISRSADSIEIKNSYATIIIPSKLVVSEITKPVDDSQKSELDDVSSKSVASGGSSEEAVWTPLFGSESSIIGSNDPIYKEFRKMREQYREFIEEILPEDIKIKLLTGISLETSTLHNNSYYFYASAAKEWETMSFSVNGFYNYEWQKTFDGVETVTTDKYGASGEYRWNFSDSDPNWFFFVSQSYRHDSIKMINFQLDEILGPGYEIKFPKIGLKWTVSAGPGYRYLEAEDYPRHNIPMAFLREDLSWDLTDLIRLEHTGYFGIDLEKGSQGTAYVMLGLVFAPKEVVSIALRLTNDFDSINSSAAIKNEQKMILSLEIPLNGRQTTSDSGESE